MNVYTWDANVDNFTSYNVQIPNNLLDLLFIIIIIY